MQFFGADRPEKQIQNKYQEKKNEPCKERWMHLGRKLKKKNTTQTCNIFQWVTDSQPKQTNTGLAWSGDEGNITAKRMAVVKIEANSQTAMAQVIKHYQTLFVCWEHNKRLLN